MTFCKFVLIVFSFLFIFISAQIFFFCKERKKIHGKWVESYRYRLDGSIDLLSEDNKVVDNIPNESKCDIVARSFTFAGHVFEMLFIIEGEKNKGPFYVKYAVGREIGREFCGFV